MRNILLASVIALTVFASQNGYAATGELDAIIQSQKQLETQLAKGKYSDLTPRAKRLVNTRQNTIFSLAEGKSSLDEMNPDDQVKLKNAVDQVNALLVNSRDGSENQEVCWRERQVGSGVMKTMCGTEKEREELRKGARDFLGKPHICVPPGCGQ